MNLIRKFVVSPSHHMPIVVNTLRKKNIIPIFDYAVEHSGTNNASMVKTEIKNIIQYHPGHFSALKLSAFDLERKESDIVKDCMDIVKMCKEHNTHVTIDSEQVEVQDKISKITDIVTQEIAKENSFDNGYIDYDNHNTDMTIYKTYQMYRKDSLYSLETDLKMYDKLGIPLCPKLVRGAYLVQDRKTNMLCDKIEDTHENYNKGMQMIVQEMKINHGIKLIAATHNENSMELLKTLINDENHDKIYFAHLLGFMDKTSDKLAQDGYNIMKYVPFGPIMKTYPYLFRRLIENYELTRFI